MAAESSMPSALDPSDRWLCDTGAAYDLVSWDIANKHTDFQSPANPINFQTANGVHRSDTTLSMTTPSLGDEENKAYIMDNSPSALSVGQRIMHRGYSFIWIKGKKPCFILPQDGVAVTTVERNCPFYDKKTEVYGYDDEKLPELCGIRIRLGDEQASACPLLCFDGLDVGDSPESGAPAQVGGSSSSAESGALYSTGSGASTAPGGQTPPVANVGGPDVNNKGTGGSAECEGGEARRVRFSDEEPESDDPNPEEIIGKASFDHLLTHKPADTAHCETCMRAKSRNVKKFVGSMKRDPAAFGDLITLDHMGMKDAWKEPGVGGMVASLDVLDHATRYKAALPVTTYEADEVTMKLREFCGNQKIKSSYLDNHSSLIKSCNDLKMAENQMSP